jgi:hypothetical protein
MLVGSFFQLAILLMLLKLIECDNLNAISLIIDQQQAWLKGYAVGSY